MASDRSERGEVSVGLSEEVRDWLDERATDEAAPDEVARRLLVAHYSVATGEGDAADLDLPAESELVTERELDERVTDLNDEFRELLEDVRDRVVQVKREADGKAPADHDHERIDERLADLEGRLAALDAAVEDAESRIDAGFENYEDVLDFLVEETADLRERVDVLAGAVVDARSELRARAAERARRERLRDLKRAANQVGVRTADCESCGASVDVAMLTAPECPRCTDQFTDVSRGTRFLQSHRLQTGDPPALTDGEDGVDDDLESIVDDGRDVPDDFDVTPNSRGGDL